jgi:sugar (pentulose or hexulose) kinase
VDEATSVIRTLDETAEPNPKHVGVYEETYEVYRSLYATLCEDMHRLDALAGS